MPQRSSPGRIFAAACAAAALAAAPPARADKDLAVDDLWPPGRVLGALELGGQNVHTVSTLQVHVTNFGLLGSLPGSRSPFSDAPSAQWPAGSGVEYLYGGGLWVGALLDGEPHVSGIVRRGNVMSFEFRPGPSAREVIYRTREQARGGARAPAPLANDDGDRMLDEDPLNGRDDDGDGQVDEDFAAISDQMFVCEFGDTDPVIRLLLPEHQPLGIHVRQSTLAWQGAPADHFIGLDYVVENRGRDVLEGVYVGFWADFDVGLRGGAGGTRDDLAGFWEGTRTVAFANEERTVQVAVAYGCDADGDDGTTPGYIGLLFLGVQDPRDRGFRRALRAHNFRMFAGSGHFSQGGDPTDDAERYRVLDGTSPRSLPPPPAGGSRPAVLAAHMDDYRVVISAGAFPRLAPGDALGFQAALVVGAGLEEMLDNAAIAQLLAAGSWWDCDANPETGVDGRETPLCRPEYQGRHRVDRCDPDCAANERPPCVVAIPEQRCLWVNDDCEIEQETGVVTGVAGRECYIPWLGDAPPPPPAMRVVPYEDRVEVYWDNRSETTPDLLRGVPDFESYHIWRADGWDRPLGTNATTGPPAHLWALLAEYDARNRFGPDRGLDELRYEPSIPVSAVMFFHEWFAAHPQAPPPDLPELTPAQNDTARALARGVRYYRFVDPPFAPGSGDAGPCPADGRCPPLRLGRRTVATRCDAHRRCRPTTPAPHPGTHIFYAVTASDHALAANGDGYSIAGPGLQGLPGANFVYTVPPTAPLPPERFAAAEQEVYAVPNPVTRTSLEPWRLHPANDDPTGLKVEFHRLPQARGKVTIWTLAGDRVEELPFDGRAGSGTVAWNLVSRNGQDVTSGVYLYTVEADAAGFRRFVGRLVVIR
jgi:hypothetical protein